MIYPYIYLTTNLVDGKIYVGRHNGKHNTYYGSGTTLKKNLKAFGKNNFRREKLMVFTNNESNEEIKNWEHFYISLLSSGNSEIGYNKVQTGGYGHTHTAETKEKISKRSKQPDNIKKLTEIRKLANKARLGTHHTHESKKQGLMTKWGKEKIIEIYKNSVLVDTCDFIHEAASYSKTKLSAVKNVLYGLNKATRSGYTFKYKEVNFG